MASAGKQVSREEYLKRYLSTDDPNAQKSKKRKLKLKPSIKKSRIRIIDVNIDMKDITADNERDNDVYADEAPIVADVIDERPQHIRIREQYDSAYWKRLGDTAEASTQQSSESSAKKYASESSNNVRRQRYDSDSDCSPPRQPTQTSGSPNGEKDASPDSNRKTLPCNSDSDISVKRFKNDNSSSPNTLTGGRYKNKGAKLKYEHKARRDSDSDLSPDRTRKASRNHEFSDSSNKHIAKRGSDSDSDFSPPRRTGLLREKSPSLTTQKNSSKHIRRGKDSDSDFSPPRRTGSIREKSPDLTTKKSNSKHVRRSKDSDSDFSPPRKTGSFREKSPSLVMKKSSSPHPSGKVREQHAHRGNNSSHHKHGRLNSDECTVETIQLRGKEKEEEEQRKMEQEKKLAEKQAKYAEWGKGIEQQNERANRFQSDSYEMSKPLARYKDDEDLDKALKDRFIEGDPMLDYIRRKKSNMNEKTTEALPRYNGPPAPPNRFNILPGYRWDGVDRSNGFEKKFFSKVNNTKSHNAESYSWSVQDM